MRAGTNTSATICSQLFVLSCYLFIPWLLVDTQTVSAQGIAETIEKNNTRELIYLLRNGENPDSPLDNGLPPVLLAWQRGHINSFETLLEMNASPHQLISQDLKINVDGELISIDSHASILTTIIRFSRLRPSFPEVALRYLRTPNQVDGTGKTIFHHHASVNLPIFGSETIAALILNCGTDPNLLDNDGISAVRLFARRFISPDGITEPGVLLKSGIYFFAAGGSDIFQTAPDGSTLFDDLTLIINKSTQTDDPRKLVWANEKSANIRKYFDSKKHPSSELVLSEIHVANLSLECMFDDVSAQEVSYWAERFPDVFPDQLTLHQYLESGGSIDLHGNAGFTFLWAAFHAGNVRTFEELLLRGADPDHRLTANLFDFREQIHRGKSDLVFDGFFGVRGETVLLAACSYPFRRKEFVRPALAVTREINQTDELDRNLLHRLLYHPLLHGQEELLQDLISAGVDLNAQTISGATPCHVAVAMNPTVIPTLVEAGADPSIRNLRGQTVEDLLRLAIQEGWSRRSDYQNVLDWLIARKK